MAAACQMLSRSRQQAKSGVLRYLLLPVLRPAGNNELKWGDMWQRHGTCADFADQSAYFALATAAAKKFDTDVSAPLLGW